MAREHELGASLAAEPCVAILGPGLLGGSIAMALRARDDNTRVHVWARRSEAVAAVTANGLADLASTDLAKVTADASLIVLAMPVQFMPEVAANLASCDLRPEALVTDVGSVKAPVVEQVGAPLCKAGIDFIGSHPMAGSEQTGLDAARADLFAGAACIVTPDANSDATKLARLEGWWAALGCRISRLDPDHHDEAIGRISHLPHLAACALALAGLEKDPTIADLAGQGFRDSTRVASGDADLWLGILRENRSAVLAPLRDLQAQLSSVLAILENLDEDSLLKFLREAKELRDGCLQPNKANGRSDSRSAN